MKLFAAQGTELDSFGVQKIDESFIKQFLNNSWQLVDLRTENEVIISQTSNHIFDLENNTITCEKPNTREQLMNVLHSISLYYELSLPLVLEDGYVNNSKIYNLQGKLQNLPKPEIKFKELVVADNVLYLDHPERVGNPYLQLADPDYFKNSDIYERIKARYDSFVGSKSKEIDITVFEEQELERFKHFNKGTDFFITNHKCNSLDKLVDDYVSGLNFKTSTIISQLQGEFFNYKSVGDLLDSLSVEEIISYSCFRNKLMACDYGVDEKFDKSLSEITDISEDSIKILIEKGYNLSDMKFIHPTFFEMLKSVSDRDLLIPWVLQDVNSNVESYNPLIYSLLKLNFSKSEIVDLLPEDYIRKEAKMWYNDIGEDILTPNQRKKALNPINKRLKRENRKIAYDNNFVLKQEVDFKAEDIIKMFKNHSYFIVPTNIYFFNNTFFKRLNQQLDKFKISYGHSESSVFIYDTRRSDFKANMIPESVRNEFGINSYSGGNQKIGPRYNAKDNSNQKIFARCDFLKSS